MHASAVCIIHKGGIGGEDYNSLNFHTAVHAHGCRHRGGGGGRGEGRGLGGLKPAQIFRLYIIHNIHAWQ